MYIYIYIYLHTHYHFRVVDTVRVGIRARAGDGATGRRVRSNPELKRYATARAFAKQKNSEGTRFFVMLSDPSIDSLSARRDE